MTTMRIICTGMNHKTAKVELREKLSFDAALTTRALSDLLRRWEAAEFVIVSTCNRTEIYTARKLHGHPRTEELHDWLAEFFHVAVGEFAGSLYTLADKDAFEHLFEVAAGLDSLVIGEPQIVAQLKDAYISARQAGSARIIMNKLFQKAFHVAKHIRSETKIASGRASVASAAVGCATESIGSLTGKCVLNIGAGKMNELMLKQLSKLGAGRLLIANRSAERAKNLAACCGGEVAPFSKLAESLRQADVVLSSTAAEVPVITRRMIDSAQRHRRWQPMVIVDIAVPRDVEASAGELKNVLLFNIDDLERTVQRTLRSRSAERAKAEKICRQHVEGFVKTLNIHSAAPTINVLYNWMRKIADQELASARGKLSTHNDTDEDTEIIRRALHRTIRRILHPAARNLRNEAGTKSPHNDAAAIRKLFELDE